MNNLLKYLSTAPVLLIIWLNFTATIIIAFNFIFPNKLMF